MITRFELPPIVVTLGTLSAYRGAIFVASKGAWVSDQDIHAVIKGLPREVWLGLPALVWFALVVLALTAVFLTLRREGREIYALGGNPHAAAYVGISANKRLMMVYTLSGMLAGLAGLLWVGRYSIAYTELAAGYELTVVAACVIGGVSIGGCGHGAGRGAGRAVHRCGQRCAAGDPGFAVLAAGDCRRRDFDFGDGERPCRTARWAPDSGAPRDGG